ncbi:MAG: hypothetical protein ACETVP_03130 [Candidatus Bathyarchaeia archaeon]
MKSKTLKRKKKPERLFRIVDKVLKQVFGETATLFIYKYLEEKHSLNREDIPNQPEIFAEGLEKYLSESGASLVLGMILGESSELKLKKAEDMGFLEHLKELKKVSYE